MKQPETLNENQKNNMYRELTKELESITTCGQKFMVVHFNAFRLK